MADYNNLLTDIAIWMKRDDLSPVIPTFVQLAEQEIYRNLRLQNMIKVVSSTATEQLPGGEWVASPPDDALEIAHIESGGVRLNYVSTDQMDVDLFHAFTLTNCLILVSGDSVDMDIYYYARPPDLTSVAPANWLTTNAYDLLLHASLAQGFGYLMDEPREGKELQRMEVIMQAVQRMDDQARYTDNPLVQRG